DRGFPPTDGEVVDLDALGRGRVDAPLVRRHRAQLVEAGDQDPLFRPPQAARLRPRPVRREQGSEPGGERPQREPRRRPPSVPAIAVPPPAGDAGVLGSSVLVRAVRHRSLGCTIAVSPILDWYRPRGGEGPLNGGAAGRT